MGIGASAFLVAIGAVLTFAINKDSVDVVNIDMVGIILMVVGIVGLIISLIVSGNMNGRRGDRVVTEERVVRDDRI